MAHFYTWSCMCEKQPGCLLSLIHIYYKRYTGTNWMSAEHFDISIDSSRHPEQEAVDIIVSNLDIMFKINAEKL